LALNDDAVASQAGPTGPEPTALPVYEDSKFRVRAHRSIDLIYVQTTPVVRGVEVSITMSRREASWLAEALKSAVDDSTDRAIELGDDA
jgi:hypothetical protein